MCTRQPFCALRTGTVRRSHLKIRLLRVVCLVAVALLDLRAGPGIEYNVRILYEHKQCIPQRIACVQRFVLCVVCGTILPCNTACAAFPAFACAQGVVAGFRLDLEQSMPVRLWALPCLSYVVAHPAGDQQHTGREQGGGGRLHPEWLPVC